MQIIGFNFEKIEAERKKAPAGKIEINSNINIRAISQEKISMIKDEDVLKFAFDFSVTYKPDVADVKFNGYVLATVDKKETKDILKKWKTKKIPENLRIFLYNFILTKSNLKALQLEEELGLPTHVPLPRIQPQHDTSYTG